MVCHLLPIFLQALEGVCKLRSQVSLSPTCVSVPYLEFAAPSPPHLHLHLCPQDLGMESDWELSQVRVVESGGFHMPMSFPASFPGLMRAGE